MGAGAAGKAADAGVKGAQQAQALELKNQNEANDYQKGVLTSTTSAEQPYQTLGSTSANSLNNLLQKGFQAPTLEEAQQTPGYQFQLQQGTRAIDQNAAANGTLMTGNTGTALEKYGQDLGQSAYQSTYNNALNTYNANSQSLQAGTNIGLSSTGQLAQAGQAAASGIANTDLTSGHDQAAQINNAAAARASGYLGKNQAYQGMIGGIAGGITGGLGNLDKTGSSSMLEQAGNFFGI
jgi:hypothetical protein